MKNPTSGDFSVMLNSVIAAQHSHNFLFRGWDVTTTGNPYAHTILRGAVNKYGQSKPNYHYEDLIRLFDMYSQLGLKNPACIIDANHSNSGKKFKEQIRIVKEVMHNRKHSADIRTLVKGVMIESYIVEGNQKIGGANHVMDSLSRTPASVGKIHASSSMRLPTAACNIEGENFIRRGNFHKFPSAFLYHIAAVYRQTHSQKKRPQNHVL